MIKKEQSSKILIQPTRVSQETPSWLEAEAKE